MSEASVAAGGKAITARAVSDSSSPAFQAAVLSSELLRIRTMLAIIAGFALFVLVRDALRGYWGHAALFLPFLSIAALYEWVMFTAVRRASVAGRDVSTGLRILNVIIESQFPTIAILLLAQLPVLGKAGALLSPPLLAYLLLVLLSTLRLDPNLSLLTGVLSTAGYFGLIVFLRSGLKVLDLPAAVFSGHLIALLAGGIVAAAVSRRILTYVEAALREAELQHKVDQVHSELDLARKIQQGLLPKKAPAVAPFEVAGWNLPADQTGGDYFDWQDLADGRLAVTLADVSGHGIGPALITAASRAYARGSLPGSGSLQVAFNRLNKLLAADLPPAKFVTLVAAVLDPTSSKVEMLSAGHGPLLLYRADQNTFSRLNPDGIPLGMIPVFQYPGSSEFEMKKGDLLVLLTDGFLEWENPKGDFYGPERAEACLLKHAHLSAAEMIKKLYEEVILFSEGTSQADDLTAVVIKR
jgi:serine phosphatase RsbU (regulator of sigma subunit)